MPARIPFPLLHVHLGPPGRTGDAGVARLVSALGGVAEVRSQAFLSRRADGAGPLPVGLRPGTMLAVGRALGRLTEDPAGETRPGRAVQWPAPERLGVVHAHGAAALRAVWVAAAWRGSGARVVASPVPGIAPGPAGLWRKADLVAAPDRESRESLARRGVEHRRLRIVPPGDAGAALRLYRRLSAWQGKRVRAVDWSVAGGGTGGVRDESGGAADGKRP